MPKKLLFAIPSNTAGGAERVMSQLANYAASHGVETIWFNYDRDSSFYPLDTNIRVIKADIQFRRQEKLYKKLMSPVLEMRRYMYVRRLLKREKPDAVVAFLKTAEIIFGINAIHQHIPFITSIRNDFSTYGFATRNFRKRYYHAVKLVVCQTEAVARDLEKHIPCRHIVLPNPVDPAAVAGENSIGKPREDRIIAVGRLSAQKNFSMLIRAMDKVYKRAPELSRFTVDIYGVGPLKEQLQGEIDGLGLQDRIRLRGLVQNALAVNQNAALYVMPSNYEGFPNTLVEAMSNGIPSITTDFPSGAGRSLAGGSGERGWLVEVGNQDQLEQAVIDALTRPAEADSRATAALEYVQQFQYENVCRRWMEAIFDQGTPEERNA